MREFSYDCLNLLSRVRKSSAESWKVRVGGLDVFMQRREGIKQSSKEVKVNWLGKVKGLLRVLRAPRETDHLRWALCVFHC